MPASPSDQTWDLTADIVVVGYGFAGAIAAIEAADLGCSVVVLEKASRPGGISICSGGGARVASNADSAFRYLRQTCAGTTPDAVLKAFAEGMTEISDHMEALGRMCAAELTTIMYPGNYPLDGYEDLGFVMYGPIKGFEADDHYPKVRGLRGGARHFMVLEENIARRAIDVRLETPVERLIQSLDGRVAGVRARQADGRAISIRARRGVILACGGFEASDEFKHQFLQGREILSAAYRGNTGDGIRMAQQVGAGLWHMWHYHGTYGLRHPDPAYPFGIRLARLTDWIQGMDFPDGMQMPWIVVDKAGRRYMNEYPPYVQDTGHRPMELYDTAKGEFPRIPSALIFDEDGRKTCPLALPTFNDDDAFMSWSDDNLAEIEAGFIHRADTIAELAALMGVSSETLAGTIKSWNEACDAGVDSEFGRPAPSMMPIRTAPFYYAPTWPIVSNTQGGPVHDEHWRVLDAFGDPIPGLYEAGELGGIFGFLYVAGGNVSECYIGARRAVRHAVRSEPARRSLTPELSV